MLAAEDRGATQRPHGVTTEGIKAQQATQLDMQATQQPITRPGSNAPISGGHESQIMSSNGINSMGGLPDAGLSEKDIDVLLSELQAQEVSSNSALTAQSSTLTLRNRQIATQGTQCSASSQPTQHCDPSLLDHRPSDGIWSDRPSTRRPRTPEQQKSPGEKEIPNTAPHSARSDGRFWSQRSHDSDPVRSFDPNMTIKASQIMQRGRSYQDNRTASKIFSLDADPLSPPKTAPLQRRSVDYAVMSSPTFPTLSELRTDMPLEGGGYQAAFGSPNPVDTTPTMASFQTSPKQDGVSLFESVEVDNAVMEAQLSFVQASQGSVSFQALATLDSPTSKEHLMTDIDVDECVQDTGITAEEIASFIQGPQLEDQKWSCLFEEAPGKSCGKRFARKENAKSHVQTHLGDRQYVCKVCKTPFVRQHDLKRHFKIHTSEKPHRCPCGKDFHRQDALTRHRQRGMCVGAYDGTPKKQVKRGRPKKPRPSNEERVEKAAKTRQYVLERTRPGSTYASSISGSSEYSLPSPPSFDNVSLGASSPSLSHAAFGDFKFPEVGSRPLTPPLSPERSPCMVQSPLLQVGSPEKFMSKSPSPHLSSIPESVPSYTQLQLPAHIQDYHHSSPPELDLSSSSPATSNTIDFMTYSNANSLPETESHTLDCLNPQILNGDFQLFDGSSRDSEGAVRFEDFIDFSALDNAWSDKSAVKSEPLEHTSKRRSTDGSSLHQLGDPFMEL